MGQVRIGRNLFIVILGAFIWLISSMIASAATIPETTITIEGVAENRVCSCACTEMPEVPEEPEMPEGPEGPENVEMQDLASQEIDIKLIMTELYPAPLSGEIEYMKFLNDGDSTADLNAWYVMDASEKKYIFKDLILLPGESFTLDYDTSRISLNNSGDTVYLYDAVGNLRQSVEYPEVQKGTLLVYDGENWSFGEEEEVITEEDQGQSSQQVAFENSGVVENDNQVANQDTEPILAIQDIIEAPSVTEANQVNQSLNQANQVSNQANQVSEGESLIYYSSKITDYKNWLDDSNLTIIGRVISPAGAWVTNRCFVAEADQAIPVLCTKLAAEFVFDQVKGIQGEVVFKNGAFYRFDPTLLNVSEENLSLSGQVLSLPLEAYRIYEYQGIVKDFSEKYFKLELETENAGSLILRWAKNNNWEAVAEGELIKGLAMADADGQLWLWQIWEKLEMPLLEGEIIDNTNEEMNSDENPEAATEPEMPAAYLGLGAAGILGGGKLAWTYREALKKFIPTKFKI